jgi:hypothetical protein
VKEKVEAAILEVMGGHYNRQKAAEEHGIVFEEDLGNMYHGSMQIR